MSQILSNPSSPFSPFLNFSILLVILLGIFVGFVPFRLMIYSQMSQDWPQVEGAVISSNVEERYRGLEGLGRKEYLPRVWFMYRVGQRKFISKSMSLVDEFFSDRKLAEKVVNEYPVGTKIIIKYDSRNPVMAFSRESIPSCWDVLRAGAGVFFVLCGIVALNDLLSRGRRR